MCRLSSLPLSEALNQLAGADNTKILLHTVVGREILTELLVMGYETSKLFTSDTNLERGKAQRERWKIATTC